MACARTLAVLLLAAGALAPPAAGHGVMVQPPSRNWLAYMSSKEYNPHSLSVGGAHLVSDGGRLRYPAGRRSYCGDAYNEEKWDRPGAVVTTYVPGQVINVDVVVAVQHMGRMTMQICPLDAKPGQGKCKNLYMRAPGWSRGFKSWFFPGIKDWTGGNWGGDGPRYGDGTYQAYQLPYISDGAGWGCSGQRECNMFKGMWVYRTQWRLPQDFKCDHCKLQWVWTTGHSCWPACEKGNPMPQCTNQQVFKACGEPGAAYPEEFMNCADVRVTDAARVDPATNFPPWNWAVSVVGGNWGTVRPSVMNVKDAPDGAQPLKVDPVAAMLAAVQAGATAVQQGKSAAAGAVSAAMPFFKG